MASTQMADKRSGKQMVTGEIFKRFKSKRIALGWNAYLHGVELGGRREAEGRTLSTLAAGNSWRQLFALG